MQRIDRAGAPVEEATVEGKIEIVDGLTVGERVVTLGANLLRDGGKIRDVTNRADTGGGPPQGGRPQGGGGPGGQNAGGGDQ